MNFELIVVGKTDSAEIVAILSDYMKRINRYAKFSVLTIPDVKGAKNLPAKEQSRKEGELILKNIQGGDAVVLLDEKGHEFSSVEFSGWLQKAMASGNKKLVFVIGGPYGFSDQVRERSSGSISLSRMTFSHQMVRVIFAEQLYRAFTILAGEPYHHA